MEFKKAVFPLPKDLNPAGIRITDQSENTMTGEYDPVTGNYKLDTAFVLQQEGAEVHWYLTW